MHQDIRLVPVGTIHKNPWNPNRMEARVFEAARESIRLYGFLDPVTVRPHPTIADEWEVVDGEHRWLASIEEGYAEISVNVVNLTDPQAKKLTLILNETRGEADTVLLARLIADLSLTDGDDLATGLPFTAGELEQLLSLAATDWDSFEASKGPTVPDPTHAHSVVLRFDTEQMSRFGNLIATISHELQTEGIEATVLAALADTAERLRS